MKKDVDSMVGRGESSAIASLRNVRVMAKTPLLTVDKLDIYPGELISITGESGAGKTTLLRLLSGATAPGTTVTGHISVPARTALIMQDSLGALNPLVRCDKQVQLMSTNTGAAARAAARSALAACGIEAALAHRYPLQLSGGQRQRVAIAAALAARPDLLLADEPTSALDPIATLGVVDALQALHAATGAAVVVATHDEGVAAAISTRHLQVADGRVLEAATGVAL